MYAQWGLKMALGRAGPKHGTAQHEHETSTARHATVRAGPWARPGPLFSGVRHGTAHGTFFSPH